MTPAEHAAERERVAASLLLADTRTDRHNIYVRRPRVVIGDYRKPATTVWRCEGCGVPAYRPCHQEEAVLCDPCLEETA